MTIWTYQHNLYVFSSPKRYRGELQPRHEPRQLCYRLSQIRSLHPSDHPMKWSEQIPNRLLCWNKASEILFFSSRRFTGRPGSISFCIPALSPKEYKDVGGASYVVCKTKKHNNRKTLTAPGILSEIYRFCNLSQISCTYHKKVTKIVIMNFEWSRCLWKIPDVRIW